MGDTNKNVYAFFFLCIVGMSFCISLGIAVVMCLVIKIAPHSNIVLVCLAEALLTVMLTQVLRGVWEATQNFMEDIASKDELTH